MENKSKRTLVLGDIHGGVKSLLQVLNRSNFSVEEDKLICLGDYVDGWSESAEVVELLIEMKKTCTFEPICLRGNHDVWCQEWLNTGFRQHIWVVQGGQATVDSYTRTGYLTKDSHRDFFNGLHNYHIDEQNRGFVHGGFISKNGLGHEVYESDYYWDRDMWGLACLQDGKIHETTSEEASKKLRRFEKHKEIYIGHTATPNWGIKPHLKEYQDERQPKNGGIMIPMNRCNVWNMDTGGGFGGKLSIMDIDTKEFWQSDYMKELYPNEKGR